VQYKVYRLLLKYDDVIQYGICPVKQRLVVAQEQVQPNASMDQTWFVSLHSGVLPHHQSGRQRGALWRELVTD
jgi:hypothetical protein